MFKKVRYVNDNLRLKNRYPVYHVILQKPFTCFSCTFNVSTSLDATPSKSWLWMYAWLLDSVFGVTQSKREEWGRCPDGYNRMVVHITTATSLAASGTQTCPIIIRKSQFARRKEKSVQWWSYQYFFYTQTRGYRLRMCLCWRWRYSCVGPPVPHDDKLKWLLKRNSR